MDIDPDDLVRRTLEVLEHLTAERGEAAVNTYMGIVGRMGPAGVGGFCLTQVAMLRDLARGRGVDAGRTGGIWTFESLGGTGDTTAADGFGLRELTAVRMIVAGLNGDNDTMTGLYAAALAADGTGEEAVAVGWELALFVADQVKRMGTAGIPPGPRPARTPPRPGARRRAGRKGRGR